MFDVSLGDQVIISQNRAMFCCFSQMISSLLTKTLSTVQNVSKQAKAAQAAGHCKPWGGGTAAIRFRPRQISLKWETRYSTVLFDLGKLI